MTSFAQKCKDFALDIIFPNRCPFCGNFIMWNETICKDCKENISKADELICRRCGKLKCQCGSGFNWDMVFASCFYNESSVRSAMLRFKTNGEGNIAGYAARDIVSHMGKENVPKPDMVVPVPMGRKKRAKRGYNQAELLAERIGVLIPAPVRKDIIFKRDSAVQQHELDRKDRAESVKSLFYTGNVPLNGKSVMICDDILTTGATLNECAGLVRSLGAERIIAAVCAVTELNDSIREGA